MGEILRGSAKRGYRHYFYGSTEETLGKLEEVLEEQYPEIQVARMYSPPFRPLTKEDKKIVDGVARDLTTLPGISKGFPEWMRKNNMEWFYRLMQDPKRLLSNTPAASSGA